MLTQLKRLFGGGKRSAGQGSSASANGPRPGFKQVPLQSTNPRRVELTPQPARSASPVPDVADEEVSIPLQSVINALPADLKRHVVPMDLGGATLTVALHRVLSQLPSGVVKLSFGVLRSAAPPLFSVNEEFDARDIELPLNEILVRINPALLPRPANQKSVTTIESMEDSFIVAASSPAPRPVSKPPAPGPIRVPLPSNAPAPKASAATNPAPAPVAAKEPAVSPARESLIISLASLAATWPPEVRSEIGQLKCGGAQVFLPEQMVKLGMKQGKVAFPWQVIRGWIDPAPPAAVSKHDSTMLVLPLEVLMPLFVSRLKQLPKTQSRVFVDESIPPLFGPATPPEEREAEAAESSANSTESTTGTKDPAVKPKTPSTDFKNRYISPTEVVTRASALEGVGGALVVLPEGLLVAAKVLTNQNPDALAAFLAGAWGRVSKSAEEAQVGELSQMEFTAQGIPWKIFRLHGVLFAAFGCVDGVLPIPELAAIAGEFELKKRG